MTVAIGSEVWRLGAGELAEDLRTMRMAMAINALGLPAVAVPVGVGAGLPQVAQVIGPAYREAVCFDAAQAIVRQAVEVDQHLRAGDAKLHAVDEVGAAAEVFQASRRLAEVLGF